LDAVRRPDRSRCLALAIGAALMAVGCTYPVSLGTVTTYRLVALQCGTWDSTGVHSSGEYFVGHSTFRPNDTISYFVFDLSPVRGKTIAGASLVIPGTNDWKVTVPEPGTTNRLYFKLGTTPEPAGMTLDEVTSGTSDAGVYQQVRAEQDLGFAWVPSGSTVQRYDAFHYDSARLTRAVDAGGMFVLFAVDRFASQATTEEYLYGQGICPAGITFDVEVE
jgi:hypothetical protein